MSISIRTTLVVVTAALGLSTDSIAQEPMPTEPAATADPNLWLEDVLGDKALDWVRARNADSRKELTAGETFGKLEQRILSILDSTARIPFASKRGEHYYNLWQDAANPRGLWRRTTLEQYLTDQRRQGSPEVRTGSDRPDPAMAVGEGPDPLQCKTTV
jgi:hypothetical protein